MKTIPPTKGGCPKPVLGRTFTGPTDLINEIYRRFKQSKGVNNVIQFDVRIADQKTERGVQICLRQAQGWEKNRERILEAMLVDLDKASFRELFCGPVDAIRQALRELGEPV